MSKQRIKGCAICLRHAEATDVCLRKIDKQGWSTNSSIRPPDQSNLGIHCDHFCPKVKGQQSNICLLDVHSKHCSCSASMK